MSNVVLTYAEEECRKALNEVIETRRSLYSLYRDHCFNKQLSLALRLELYRRCDSSIPNSLRSMKRWTASTRKFIRKLNSRIRRLERKDTRINR